MSAAEVLDVTQGLAAAGIRWWIVGGWGIDALVGRQTRDHHDLDLLVRVDDLPALRAWLEEAGFRRAYEWEENRPVDVDGHVWDTAFVEQHDDGRELDVHALRVEDEVVLLATADPWEFPSEDFEGTGTIAGRSVACVSAEAQRAMHRGYELPETHRADLRLLDDV